MPDPKTETTLRSGDRVRVSEAGRARGYRRRDGLSHLGTVHHITSAGKPAVLWDRGRYPESNVNPAWVERADD